MYGLGYIPRIWPVYAIWAYIGKYRPVHRGFSPIYSIWAYTLDMGCPRRILDKPAIPRTIEWFVSARGRMRAPAGAHYARARVYMRPHARGRYEGPNPCYGLRWVGRYIGPYRP